MKEKLTMASMEPVDLDNTTPANEAASAEDLANAPEKTQDPEQTDKQSGKATLSADEGEKSKTDEKAKTDEKSKTDEESKTENEAKAEKAEAEAAESKPEEAEEDAPPPPMRPLSPLSQIKKDLKDAFPSSEDRIIEAVLIASEGRVDPAFNALLYLSDPSFKPEPLAPAPVPAPRPSTLTDDEKLARKLQKEFEKEDRRRSRKQRPPQPQNQDESSDEFESLKETFTQGYEEAKTTINSWVSGLSRKIAGEEEQPKKPRTPRQKPKLFGALGGSSFNSNSPNHNFDEDPEILASDFHNKATMDENPPQLPTRDRNQRWVPLNSDVPVNQDAFLVTDSEDEDKDKK
ncbi:putative CUE domain-containing protein [Clavispora lusitaniae]|uniref:CUE domain-containing protein n=1 Tax=Clavispora lusitaniae TaxID=36911 RepID=A0ACD0WRG9_CLALS|nr:putative CUE domain-containing protein [Clavispora lusitaniae]QFZ35664.1 putative CUE domain-containing protein [Clavispora lusitaniae]QFZ41346.1 putative CUE domain-containing protein [Clavispora lusitaniae]QFZ47024.1 putative CUE domain-containing protein [Clavispora lusitaniae]QFZ52701.1 putative CUE domain-containing protein [Clavispora lusitaniae]